MEFNKDLIAASSTPIVLAILTEGDSYGYAIIKRVQELSGGQLEWTDGMLYPVLHRLERLGFIKARWEEAESGRKRKYYRITAQGKAQLAEERKQWQAVDATLKGLWKSIAVGTMQRKDARTQGEIVLGRPRSRGSLLTLHHHPLPTRGSTHAHSSRLRAFAVQFISVMIPGTPHLQGA